MTIHLILGGLFLSSSLWAGSVSCTLNDESVTNPSFCNLNNGELDVLAKTSSEESFSGNVFSGSGSAYTSTQLTLPSTPAPVENLPTGSASAEGLTLFTLPYLPADYRYDISVFSLGDGGTGSVNLPLPLDTSNCEADQSFVMCTFSLTGAQMPSSFTITESGETVFSAENIEGFGFGQASFSISQFNASGNPVAFALAPEPATATLYTLAGIMCGVLALRRRKL